MFFYTDSCNTLTPFLDSRKESKIVREPLFHIEW